MRRGLRRFGLYPAFPRFGFQKQPPRLLRGSSLLKGRATQWPFFFLVFWSSTALVHSGRTASTALAPFLVAEPKYRRRTSWSSCGLRCRCDMGRADSTVPCLASSIPLRIPAKSSWSSCALFRRILGVVWRCRAEYGALGRTKANHGGLRRIRTHQNCMCKSSVRC